MNMHVSEQQNSETVKLESWIKRELFIRELERFLFLNNKFSRRIIDDPVTFIVFQNFSAPSTCCCHFLVLNKLHMALKVFI